MNVPRALYLLSFVGALSVAVVILRTEQIRAGARIAALQTERRAIQRETWIMQMESARLVSPEQIRDRVARWSLELQEPGRLSDAQRDAQLAQVR